MNITNLTSQDYWFGPLHLPANAVNFFVDDVASTSLYLTDDSVADAINFLYAQVPVKITVTGQALPFPRPTGKPDLVHGDGSPEGLVYASEGTLYVRRDRSGIYKKSTIVHLNTGWDLVGDLDPLRPSAATVNSASIARANANADLAALTTAQLTFVAVYLQAGVPVNSITAVSGSTAAGTPVNQWFALYDQNLIKLAVTADDTSTAWAANSAKTLAISGAFTPTYTGLHYLGVMVKATTVPTLAGSATRVGVTGLAPKTAGTSTSGLTNPASAPATAAALTAIAATPYVYTS